MTELSADLAEAKVSLEDLRSGIQAPIVASQHTSDKGWVFLPDAKNGPSLTTRTLIVVVVGLIFSGYTIPLFFAGVSGLIGGFLLLLSLVAPVLGGAWVGANWRGKHLGSYALLGFMAGIISATIMVSLLGLLSSLQSWVLIGRGSIVAVFLAFSTTLLFVTGGIIGDRIEKRKSKLGKSQRDAEAQERAQAKARRITGSDEGRLYKATVETLKLLQPFAPVITGLLGIIGPVLIYYLGIG